MQLERKYPVTVQIKDREGSRSLTIYESSVDSVFNKVQYLFRALDVSEGGEVTLRFKK